MLDDELSQPLRRRKWTERLWAARPSALQLASAAALLLFGAPSLWLLRTPAPYGGEPVLVLRIPPPRPIETASTAPASAAETPPDAPAGEAASPESGGDGVETVGSEPEQVVQNDTAIIITPRRRLPPAPIASVAEDGPFGLLPKIGAGNKKPSSVYARTASSNVMVSDAPKIALLLGGMGLNEDLTRRAIGDLPGDITLAFAPYGENLQAQVNKARAEGHETMLQLPMEPFAYPAANPGPRTLLTSAGAQTNLDALLWHMGRFAGYTGIINYMGARFFTEPAALTPVFTEMKKRGLIFLADGGAHNAVDDVAARVRLPIRSADASIDVNPDAASIAKALAGLESEARSKGIAIGTGTGLGVTIDAVAQWSKTLNDRGIMLIPMSAAFRDRAG